MKGANDSEQEIIVFTPAPTPNITATPTPIITTVPTAIPIVTATAKPAPIVTLTPSASVNPTTVPDNNSKKEIITSGIALNKKSFIYNGKEKRPFVTVSHDSIELTENTDYTVTYSNNIKVGTASVTINGIGNYSGSINKVFKIVPKGTPIKGKPNAKHKGFVVKWKKQPKAITGYQVQYSTDKKFKGETTVTKTVKKKSITKLKTGALKARKKYYIRVRTYKDVKDKKYYSGWSTAKTVITKR